MPEYKLCLGIMPLTKSPGNPTKHALPTDWVLLLIHPCETKCDWFFSAGGPRTNTRYVRKYLPDQPFREADIFSRFEFVGTLKSSQYIQDAFIHEWRSITPGPSQFFILRLLSALAKHGLVKQGVVDGLLLQAEYSLYEWSCNRDGLTRLDQAFVEGREVDECWV
ncbi:hypothetical protein BJX70DRAFT_403857 [Aspergillus crustosus]